MDNEYYFRINMDGEAEIRIPMEIPKMSFLSCEDFIENALASMPKLLADDEITLHKSSIAIQTCTACMGTGCECAPRESSYAFPGFAHQGVGWGNPPALCSVCDGSGSYI